MWFAAVYLSNAFVWIKFPANTILHMYAHTVMYSLKKLLLTYSTVYLIKDILITLLCITSRNYYCQVINKIQHISLSSILVQYEFS